MVVQTVDQALLPTTASFKCPPFKTFILTCSNTHEREPFNVNREFVPSSLNWEHLNTLIQVSEEVRSQAHDRGF